MAEKRSADAFKDRPWGKTDLSNRPEITAVPTMLAADECAFYHWLTKTWMQGAGDVVDLGAFIGGSTARLAAGHADARRPGQVHCYDRFTSDETTKARILYRQGIAPFEGNDIYPLSRELLSPWSDRITFHRGEIELLGWSGGPIELLVVDAFKKAGQSDTMTAQFFPELIPDVSLIVHQDFLHWSQPWLAAQMHLLGDAVEPVAHARDDTVAFLVRAPMTPARLAAARIGELTDDRIQDCLAATRARLEPWGLAPRIDEMSAALRANPGVRAAWQMKR